MLRNLGRTNLGEPQGLLASILGFNCFAYLVRAFSFFKTKFIRPIVVPQRIGQLRIRECRLPYAPSINRQRIASSLLDLKNDCTIA